MPRPRTLFRVKSKRSSSGITYWIAVYWDERKQKKRSTGIVDDGTVTSRREAEKLALALLGEQPVQLAPVTFAQYASEFWNWQTSKYIQARLARDPQALSQEHCANQYSNLRNHLLPALGSLTLAEITPQILDDLVTDLLRGGLSSGTVKHVINAASPVFEQALRSKLIACNPIPSMLPFTPRRKKRDAFRPEELSKLLSPANVETYWAQPLARQKLYRDGWLLWALAVLCFVTGARFSSVASLRRDDIQPAEWAGVQFYVLSLEWSVTPMQGRKKGSKTGQGTKVPVAAEVMEMIIPHLPAEGQLFPSFGRHGILTGGAALRGLKRAMSLARIKDRKERLLGYHSFRHSFVSRTRAAGLPAEIRAAFTEHRDLKTESGYSHPEPFELLAVLPVQRGILAG